MAHPLNAKDFSDSETEILTQLTEIITKNIKEVENNEKN